jgi:two-component system phosphate regulon sensor histidine kinase PhoR
MIDPKKKKIVFLQIISWTLFYLVSIMLYKIHYGIHLDTFFVISYSISTFIFFSFTIWLTIKFSKPNIEEMEDRLFFQEKEFNLQNNNLAIENRLYKILFHSIEDPVFVFTSNLNIFFYNNRFAKLFGLKEDIHNIPLIEISRNLEFQNFIAKCILENRQLILPSFSFSNDQDPNRTYFDMKIIPIKFSSHFLCVLHEVTEKRLADQIREDFISNFSHEIRTPLTILNGQIQNLKILIPTTLELENAYKKIENNSRRLTCLFDDMLSLTSIEKQKRLNLETFNIEPMIDIVAQDLALKYPNKKINFTFELNQNDFFGDYNLIEQTLINLIDNAIKYSPIHSTIQIMTAAENNYSILSIKDNGIGIPDDQKHRVYERFFRVDSSRSSDIAGTGLGLSIVKHIVQKHNGKLKMVSEVNVGTTITVLLPIKS